MRKAFGAVALALAAMFAGSAAWACCCSITSITRAACVPTLCRRGAQLRTYFYNDKLKAGETPVSISHSSFGPALQVGVDVQVAKNLFVNADLKKIWMRTSASAGGADLGSLKIDPWVLGVGVGMKF